MEGKLVRFGVNHSQLVTFTCVYTTSAGIILCMQRLLYNNKNRADVKCKNESVAILVIVLWDRDSCKGMRVCFVHLHANCVCMCAFVLYVWILFHCVLCVCERQTVRKTEGGICVSILSTNRCNIKIMYWFQGSSTSIKNLLIYSSALSSNIYELLFT